MQDTKRDLCEKESAMVKVFKYLTGILDKKEKNLLKILTVFSLISPAISIFNFSVLLFIVNSVVENQKVSREIIVITFLTAAISVFRGFFDWYNSRIRNRFIYDGSQKLSERMCELLLKEDLLQHNQKSSMQAVAMVRSDAQSCINIMLISINTWVNMLTMAGYFAVMIYTSRLLGLVSCLVFMLLMGGVFFYYRRLMQDYGEKSRECSIKTSAQVTIAYGNFKEIKIADTASAVLYKYHNASEEYAQIQKQFQYKKSTTNMIMQNFVMAAMFILLGWFLHNPAGNSKIFFTSIVVYFTLMTRMIPMAYGIVGGLNDIKFSQKPYEILREGINRYSQIKESERKAEGVRQKVLTFEKGLFVKNLNFSYDGRKKIFEDASIDIPAGYTVAVIGISGIGKTTFLDLVLGLLTPQSGKILYDDYDIVSHMDEEGECRADIGDITNYIPQTVHLNGETVRNNVVFFEKGDNIDEAKVIECLKCAQVWEDVRQMPDGIHTLIGENGTAISGGQRQRIALARALYKDFELLVMDEATAALDMETEKAVIDAIRQVKKNRTMLMVTHHMSLANECDIVYKIENRKFVRVR